ncbi:MAG: DUF6768 family protein [Idiomarina sp.]
MSNDKRIKQDLADAAKQLDELMTNEQSITSYLKLGFQSGSAKLVKIGYVLAIALTLLMFFTGYHFFTVEPSGQTFWGICLLLSFNAQVATKLWIFSQSNRNFLAKEIRLMELRLKNQP